MGTTIAIPSLIEAAIPDIEDLPFVYVAYDYLDAADLAAIVECFDNMHREYQELLGPVEPRRLRIQGVETRGSIVMAFLAFVTHYGPIAFHAIKDTAPVALAVYQIQKIRKDMKEKKEATKPEARSLEEKGSPTWDELTDQQRDTIKKHSAQLMNYLATKEHIQLLVAGDGKSLAVPSTLSADSEAVMYGFFEAFDEWRSRNRQSGRFQRDSDAVSAWLEVEGYEYFKNHFNIYLLFNSFLSSKGLAITYVLSYQTFMDGYRLQVAKNRGRP